MALRPQDAPLRGFGIGAASNQRRLVIGFEEDDGLVLEKARKLIRHRPQIRQIGKPLSAATESQANGLRRVVAHSKGTQFDVSHCPALAIPEESETTVPPAGTGHRSGATCYWFGHEKPQVAPPKPDRQSTHVVRMQMGDYHALDGIQPDPGCSQPVLQPPEGNAAVYEQMSLAQNYEGGITFAPAGEVDDAHACPAQYSTLPPAQSANRAPNTVESEAKAVRFFGCRWFVIVPWLLVLGYTAVSVAQDYRKFQELKGSEQALLRSIQSELLRVSDQFHREVRIVDEQFRTEEEHATIAGSVDKFTSANRDLRHSIGQLVSIRFFPRSAAKLQEASQLLDKEEQLIDALVSTKLDLIRTQNAIARLPATVEFYRTRKDYYAGRLDLLNWLAAQKALAQSETALNYLQDQVATLESSRDYLKQQCQQTGALLRSTANELQQALQAEHAISYRDYLQARLQTFDLRYSLRRFLEGRG